MKLRLLLLDECNRSCKGCCNKDWNLDALPVCESFAGYESIMLTGGEPMLVPDTITHVVQRIRAETDAPIHLYTAWREDPWHLASILTRVDGLTLTLHTRKDTESLRLLVEIIQATGIKNKSLRLNVFHGISTGDIDLSAWHVKKNIRWVKDCPLPADEVFMRYRRATND